MFEYLWSVWRAIQLGLELTPDVVQIVETYPNANWIAFGVVMTAGISLLLGQSVILFVNQVSPGRFVASLVGHGVVLVVGWLIWSFVVWTIGNWLFDEEPSFAVVSRLIGLSYAPLVFGFLILMPYLGPFVRRVLYAWTFMIALRAVGLTFHVGFWPALVCVGAGWLLLMLATATVGRPIVAIRNWAWQRLTKSEKGTPVEKLLKQFALDHSIDPSTPPTSKGDEP